MIAMPDEAKEVFWNINVAKLDLKRDQDLILATVLSRGRTGALRWLFVTYDKSTIRDFVVRDARTMRRLPAPDRALWLRVLAPGQHEEGIVTTDDWGLTRQVPA